MNSINASWFFYLKLESFIDSYFYSIWNISISSITLLDVLNYSLLRGFSSIYSLQSYCCFFADLSCFSNRSFALVRDIDRLIDKDIECCGAIDSLIDYYSFSMSFSLLSENSLIPIKVIIPLFLFMLYDILTWLVYQDFERGLKALSVWLIFQWLYLLFSIYSILKTAKEELSFLVLDYTFFPCSIRLMLLMFYCLIRSFSYPCSTPFTIYVILTANSIFTIVFSVVPFPTLFWGVVIIIERYSFW